MKANPNASILNCRRLGQWDVNRVRPVQIKLNSADEMLTVLKSYKVQNNIYLNRDLTSRQRNHCYNIRKEFRNRVANGEVDLMLKYKKGIPKILKKNAKPSSSPLAH
jgi:small nuclear ribonucleoprotein (snRNP)-like protein